MQGGTYVREANGTAKRVGGTEPHQDGSRARNANGTALNGRGAEPAPTAPPEPTPPAAPAAIPETGGRRRQPNKPE